MDSQMYDFLRFAGASHEQALNRATEGNHNPYTVCVVCGLPLDPDKGEVFLTDDGEVYCNDHYPDRLS